MSTMPDCAAAHLINGVPGTLFTRVARDDMPQLFKRQEWESDPRPFPEYGRRAMIKVKIRFDDSCRNNKQSFAVTGEIFIPGKSDCEACGCIHDEIKKAFPELAHLIRWHLFDSTGPMHYYSNVIYMAGDRDHNGLRAGESRQLVNRTTGLPLWTLVAVNSLGIAVSDTDLGREHANEPHLPLYLLEKSANCDADNLPAVPTLKWVPMLQKGEGKPRDFEAARSIAVWPDATDEQLSSEPDELRAMLEARLPGLIADFRADVESAGMLWEAEESA